MCDEVVVEAAALTGMGRYRGERRGVSRCLRARDARSWSWWAGMGEAYRGFPHAGGRGGGMVVQCLELCHGW